MTTHPPSFVTCGASYGVVIERDYVQLAIVWVNDPTKCSEFLHGLIQEFESLFIRVETPDGDTNGHRKRHSRTKNQCFAVSTNKNRVAEITPEPRSMDDIGLEPTTSTSAPLRTYGERYISEEGSAPEDAPTAVHRLVKLFHCLSEYRQTELLAFAEQLIEQRTPD